MPTDVPSSVLVLDAGNNIIKGKTATSEVAYVHALQEITLGEYNTILDRAPNSTPPDDYIKVNGKPYAIGEQGARHGTLTRLTGTARYTPEYYGVFVASTLFRLYRRNAEVALFSSHPTGDVAYREDLAKAAWGDWLVEHGKIKYRFTVSYVNTFDEPIGGLMNVILKEDGKHYARSDINGGRALVIDIGGGTTDFQGVNKGGELDYSMSMSIDIGIQNVERDFELNFRRNHKDDFKDNRSFDHERTREAIATGCWRGGGREYDCRAEVREASYVLLNRIRETYVRDARGAYSWDHIILTGGGSAMLYDYLIPLLDHKSIILADNPNEMHMANVRGGRKLWKLYEAQGLL